MQGTSDTVRGSEDMQLLLIKSGDRAAIGWLFEEIACQLYEVLLREWRNAPLAEDAVQHAFEKLLRDPASITARNMRELRAWFFTVARNYLKDQAKVGDGKWALPFSSFDHTSSESNHEDQDYPESIADDAPTVEEMAEYANRSDAIRTLLTELGSPCKEILSLYYLDGIGLAEVANNAGLTLDQVKKRKRHCLALLAKMANARGILSIDDI